MLLTLGYQTFSLWNCETKFPVVSAAQFVVLYYDSPRKLIQLFSRFSCETCWDWDDGSHTEKFVQHFKFLVLLNSSYVFHQMISTCQHSCPLLGSGLHYSTRKLGNINCRRFFFYCIQNH